MTKKLPQNISPLVIILVSVITVFVLARSLTYLVLIGQVLPSTVFLSLNGYHIHHFVYGNILIIITSFASIGLGIRKHKQLFALFYGIGLGLVLDELLLWLGDVRQLTSVVLWLPHSITAIAATVVIISTIVAYRLYVRKNV